ncbi:hypothetical protein [uncultured Gammaproteobacteria bacterium]|nr:hypothetical protein [uncultured Gammaproteobacteria bacterium]
MTNEKTKESIGEQEKWDKALKKIQEKEEEFRLDIIRRKRNQKLLYLLVLLFYGVAFFTSYLICSGYFSDNMAYTFSLPSHYFDY